MYNLAVFASGNGTTLQCIIDSIKSKVLNANIVLVVSDNPQAFALKRAKKEKIPTYIIKSKGFSNIDSELFELLGNYDINLIVLVGYLKLIGNKLIDKYTIINTHPSLLPKFGGKGMYGINVHRAVVSAKEKISGATIHFVNSHYDKGNIISQTKINVLETDTAEDVSKKVQLAEKIQIVEVLKNFVNGVY